MDTLGMTRERLAVISWALFLVLVISAICVAASIPIGPLTAIMMALAAIFAYRFPYATLYGGIFFTPFLGLMLSLPTGSMLVGERAFGGYIDVSVGEVVMLFALFGWALRLLILWRKRKDEAWRPRLPLIWATGGLVAAHLASAFSFLAPDPLLVAKFSMRPVLYEYLAFVALPVNYIRSRKRLVAALGVFAAVATFAAVTGMLAMFFPSEAGFVIGRARPLAIFGISAMGENQNELAELLVVSAPLTLALALLMRETRLVRLWAAMAGFQSVIALLTFTRTAWIVMAAQVAFLAYGPFRKHFRAHVAALSVLAILLMPLALAMGAYSVSRTAQSSNSTRLMLSEIAWELFKTSPVFGAGAGTFFDRVGSTGVFLIEYGDPLDSHGWIQKIGAETGLIGLAALAFFIGVLVWRCLNGFKLLRSERYKRIAALLVSSAFAGILYQVFNTDYWTGKMWLPIGFAMAGLYVLAKMEDESSRDILEA